MEDRGWQRTLNLEPRTLNFGPHRPYGAARKSPLRCHKKFAQAAKTLMDSSTEKRRDSRAGDFFRVFSVFRGSTYVPVLRGGEAVEEDGRRSGLRVLELGGAVEWGGVAAYVGPGSLICEKGRHLYKEELVGCASNSQRNVRV